MVRIENPTEIEFSNAYFIGWPARYASDPAPYMQLVATSDDVVVRGFRVTGSVFRAEGPRTRV